MRLCLMLPAQDGLWRSANIRNGFTAIARQLEATPNEIFLIEPGAPADTASCIISDCREGRIVRRLALHRGIATFAGPGPGAMTESWRQGYAMAQALREERFDAVLAPLQEGLAQPLLMARATGEAFTNAAIFLWGEPPSSLRTLASDEAFADPGVLIADALERTAVQLADRVFVSNPALEQAIRMIAPATVSFIHADFPISGVPDSRRSALTPDSIREIVFVGMADRRHGFPLFLDAIEALDRSNRLGDRCITFLGPMRRDAPGMSKSLLGLRARNWRFNFKVVDAETQEDVMAYLQRPGLMPVFAGELTEDTFLAGQLIAGGMPLLAAAHHPLGAMLEGETNLFPPGLRGLTEGLKRALTDGVPAPVSRATGTDWPALIGDLDIGASTRPSPSLGGALSVSVCVNHYERPVELSRALASVEHGGIEQPEIVLFDNGSTAPDALKALEQWQERATSPHHRLVRSEELIPLPAARNRAARAASGEIIVFLDDDNVVAPQGLARFARAFAKDRFDIVVTCLDIFDRANAPETCDERLLFLGDAGSAGLFFNCFGDSNMAVNRERFLAIGGFDETCHVCDDWVFLAKARAAGLRIGVVQEPAIRYARDDAAGETKWRKRDLEGPRNDVLRAYAGKFDAMLVARLAQGLSLPLL